MKNVLFFLMVVSVLFVKSMDNQQESCHNAIPVSPWVSLRFSPRVERSSQGSDSPLLSRGSSCSTSPRDRVQKQLQQETEQLKKILEKEPNGQALFDKITKEKK